MTVELLHKMIAAHRSLRHDFMNDIQVISGYLQIGQAEKALMYAKKTACGLDLFNPLAKFSLPLLQAYFLSCLTSLSSAKDGLSFEIDGDISAWADVDLTLAMFMEGLLDPLREDICNKELKIIMKVLPLPALEIEFLCARDALANGICNKVKVLNEEYKDKLDITLIEMAKKRVLLGIKRR
jgi:hypothetical protein